MPHQMKKKFINLCSPNFSWDGTMVRTIGTMMQWCNEMAQQSVMACIVAFGEVVIVGCEHEQTMNE